MKKIANKRVKVRAKKLVKFAQSANRLRKNDPVNKSRQFPTYPHTPLLLPSPETIYIQNSSYLIFTSQKKETAKKIGLTLSTGIFIYKNLESKSIEMPFPWPSSEWRISNWYILAAKKKENSAMIIRHT